MDQFAISTLFVFSALLPAIVESPSKANDTDTLEKEGES
jgi:hypothetical protein